MITHAYTSKSGALIGKNGIYSGCIIKLPRCGSITLGRDSREVDIAITANCSKISRVHCDVSYDYSNGYYIVNDFSTNGTFINENGIKTMIKNKQYELTAAIFYVSVTIIIALSFCSC